MIFPKIFGFAVLALVVPAIAAPVGNEASDMTFNSSNRTSVGYGTATMAGEVTAASFVGGICNFENRQVEECAQPDNRHNDPNSWYTLTSINIATIVDGAGHPFTVNLNKAVLDKDHGYDIYGFPQVLSVDYWGRQLFRYGAQSWDEFTHKDGHSAWCVEDQWSRGPLNCEKDKSNQWYRTLDMNCFFAC